MGGFVRKIFGGGADLPDPAPAPAPVKKTDTAPTAVETRKRAAGRRGRKSTILTGDGEQVTPKKKQLLGGG